MGKRDEPGRNHLGKLVSILRLAAGQHISPGGVVFATAQEFDCKFRYKNHDLTYLHTVSHRLIS
jgi:hypothetical protein